MHRSKRMLLSAALLMLAQVVVAQLSEVPLTGNPRNSQSQRALSVDEVDLFVAQDGAITYCAPEGGVDSIASVSIKACGNLQFGSITIDESCFTYAQSGALGTDMVCITICDTMENCWEREISVTGGAVIDLPFVDDFSYDGPYPNQSTWLDQHVYINYNLAERPLGLGIATFDGLDDAGRPYDRPEGVSDLLTSAFLRASRASNVFISFFFQPRGFGIAPRLRDSLSLDVKNPQGQWVNIWAKEGLPDSYTRFEPAPDFEFASVSVADTLLSDAMQFRFRNRSQQKGLQQIWHLDYVRVTEDVAPERTFEDLAFRTRPNGVLTPYSAMPYRQFRDFENIHVADEYLIDLYSHFETTANANPSNLSVQYESNTIFLEDLLLPTELTSDTTNQRNLAPGRHSFRNSYAEQVRNKLVTAMKDLPPRDEPFVVSTQYTFEQGEETNQAIPAFLRNHQATFENVFANYLAYDDGTAESGLKAENNTGIVTIVQEFSINVADQLQGVQFFFPRVEGDNENLRFNLLVWTDSLAGEPDYVQESLQPLYADLFFDTIQGYTTYDLRDTAEQKINLDLPVGKFYVGWQQVRTSVAGDISVGLDKNRSDGTDFVFFRVNEGAWI